MSLGSVLFSCWLICKFFCKEYTALYNLKERGGEREKKLAVSTLPGSACYFARRAQMESLESPCCSGGRGFHVGSPLPQANILSLELVGKLYFTIQSLMVEPTWQGYTCLYLSPQLIGSPRCGFSNLPYDVTTEQALTYPEVKSKLEASIENLRRVTDKVLNSIISSLDLLP